VDHQDNPMGDGGGLSNQPTRRSGRVTRERPNFYDALQYENQSRRVSADHFLLFFNDWLVGVYSSKIK
jgi:hypothetical protein